MGLANEIGPSPCLSVHTLNHILCEESMPSMDQSFVLPAQQNFPFSITNNQEQNDLLKSMSNQIISQQFPEFSFPDHDFSESPALFSKEMLTKEETLTSEEILKMAGTRYIGGTGYRCESYFAIPALPTEDQSGLDLAQILFVSAEMMSNRRYDQAIKLLRQCRNFSSQWGNPMQRVCYYVSGALMERIERETRQEIKKSPKAHLDVAYNFESGKTKTEFYGLVAFYTRVLPYVKLLQFTSMQAIIEAVGNANNIHVIDLGIRTGCQWTVLMQYLALRGGSSSLELLKITAVGMDGEELKVSGRRLDEFAKSLAIPFCYRTVEISSMEEINEGLFDVKQGEALAVYAPIVLRSLLYKPVLLECVVNVVKKLRPRIMVVTEIEADHNSPSFENRFIEVLFYISTYFDSLDVALPDRNDIQRVKFEEMFCGSQIRNMIVFEGNDRRVRHVRTDVWRCFFRHTGLKEMGFSYQAWYQARLLLKKFRGGDFYSVEPNGPAITIGWKGTPLVTVSAWTCN
ncbi:hypothetical protein SUGI_0375300 [Cryptomeria japonica]|uniref:DELLA protein GAI1 n=1 Tax=Cryptomeria japonica TaxID=3369 RepID=UPI002408C525|nr:DELLA protein GAI1 [Cryptomeria japonica]GLJ20606.1 hypothetical protein SUGI_0375300 [Cryptomeria japonica]